MIHNSRFCGILMFIHFYMYNVLIFKKNYNKDSLTINVATSLWPSVGVKPNTSKVGDLESSETLEALEFDSKAQNTSY